MASGGNRDVSLRNADTDDMPRIEPLWRALYKHQADHGMLLRLPDNAYDVWLKSMEPFLGRFANISLAEVNGELVGFVAGRIRTMPPYFGSLTVGAISEVFVSDRFRGRQIGEILLNFALDWFHQQGVSRVELQVVAGNPDGMKFYRRLGWREELVQMVWVFGEESAV
jgi:GNAT superfamily N-acetyltransferase